MRSDQAADDESVPIIERLSAAAPDERYQIVRGFIVQEVQTVLGMTMKPEDLDRSFPELGMDSLTATELVSGSAPHLEPRFRRRSHTTSQTSRR